MSATTERGPAEGTPVESAATPSRVPWPRLPGLDGLRAIAVTLVILFHLTPGAVTGGYIGVDIFFVISGFLITGLLLRERAATGATRLRAFWARRARRLLPALALVVLACSSVAFLIGGDLLVGLGKQVLGAGTFSYNWLAIAGGSSYFDETTPELFRNLWSLAVEEQFYLAWPFLVLLLLLIPRPRVRRWLVLAAAVSSAGAMVALSLLGADATRVYYGTDTHSFGLLLGASLALLAQDWPESDIGFPRAARFWMPVAGAVSLAGLVTLALVMPTDAPVVYRGGLAVIAVLAAFTIAGSVIPGSALGRLLDLPPLRWVGERSYGLYLWHWPVFVLVGAALPDLIDDEAGSWLAGGIALAITVVVAALSFTLLENPVRRDGFRGTAARFARAWRSSPGSTARAATLTVATVAVIAMTVGAIAVAPQRGSAQAQIEAGQAAIDDTPTPTPSPSADAPLPSGDRITAIGDSVMLAVAPSLQEDFPGIEIDAVVSRQMKDAPKIIRRLARDGELRPILLLGLGTNGPISSKTLEAVSDAAGPATQIVLVNVQAPRDWTSGVNRKLTTYAREKRSVELANWRAAIRPRLDVLAPDKIHPGGPIGGGIYTGAVQDALQRLAELPPLVGGNDYGLSPRPV